MRRKGKTKVGKREVARWWCQYLSMGVNKGEGAALAAKVDEGGGGLQVLRQTQSRGAGGEQGDHKEVHLCNCFVLFPLLLEWIE